MTNEPSAAGVARFDRYAAAKARLGEALRDYLVAVVEIGGEDAASSLELARQMLHRDVGAAIDRKLLTVPLSDVWAQMSHKDRTGERLDRGGA